MSTKQKEISLFDVFMWGMDFGQLISEQERDNEDFGDAFQGAIIARKYSMPSQVAQRRQPHSDKWRKYKAQSKKKLLVTMGLLQQGKITIKP